MKQPFNEIYSQKNCKTRAKGQNIDITDIYILFQVGYSQFAAHKFIIGNRAEYLLKYTLENGEVDSITNTIVCRIDDIQPEVFEQILRFIYTGICQLLVPETALK